MREPDVDDEHALLAVPTRARILELVRASTEPLAAAELATALGVHVTTVRFHLEQLERAGLVLSAPEPSGGRGRPRIGYRSGTLDLAEVREQMIEALADALADRGARDRSVAAGRRWADRLPEPTGSPSDVVADVFAQLGFDPEPAGDVIRLRRCPFADAARRTPQVVCRVHLGLAQGLARRAAAGRSVPSPRVDLLPFAEPDACLLTLTGRDRPELPAPARRTR